MSKNKLANHVKNYGLSDKVKELVNNHLQRLHDQNIEPVALYQIVMEEFERGLLSATLERTNGNQSEATEILGINRGTVRKKMKQYGYIVDLIGWPFQIQFH